MKIWKMFVVGAIMMLSPSIAHSVIVDRIVAIVNEDIITLSELNEAFEPYREKIERTTSGAEREHAIVEAKKHILNRLINNKLIEQRAKKQGIAVKDEEVMNYISRVLANKKMELTEFVASLEKAGLTLEKYKEEVRGDMLRNRLIRREIQSKIVISEDELGEYYKQHREDYEGKEAVRLKQILLVVPRGAPEEQVAEIRKQAEQIRERILKGESFDALAEQYSQGPAAQAGGDLGFIERGSMLPEVEEVAFKLPLREVSEVIKSPVGFHILMVTDKKGGGIKPIAEVRQEIQYKLEEQKMAERFDQWIEEYRKMSLIEIRYP